MFSDTLVPGRHWGNNLLQVTNEFVAGTVVDSVRSNYMPTSLHWTFRGADFSLQLNPLYPFIQLFCSLRKMAMGNFMLAMYNEGTSRMSAIGDRILLFSSEVICTAQEIR